MKLKVRDITLIGILSAMNVSSRWLILLPNVKPLISTVVVMTLLYNPFIGICVGCVSFIVSGFTLGMGTWVIFQCLACIAIALVTKLLQLLKISDTIILTIMAVLGGVLFGIVVSLDTLIYGGWTVFVAYWLRGLLWDLYSCIGNIIFMPIIYKTIKRIKSMSTRY